MATIISRRSDESKPISLKRQHHKSEEITISDRQNNRKLILHYSYPSLRIPNACIGKKYVPVDMRNSNSSDYFEYSKRNSFHNSVCPNFIQSEKTQFRQYNVNPRSKDNLKQNQMHVEWNMLSVTSCNK